MDRIYEANVSGSPTPFAGVVGRPRDGGIGVPETIPGAYWFDMITEELRAVVVAGSITPDGHTLTQVLAAINALIATGLGGLITVVSNVPGRVTLNTSTPFTLQWFLHNNASDDETVTFPYTFATMCRGVIPVIKGANASSSVNVQTTNYTATTFDLHAELQERAPNVAGVLCIAFGN